MAGNQELSVLAKPGELFGAVSALALTLAGDLELAPKDENESEVDLAIRLLGEIDQRAQAMAGELGEREAELEQLKRSLAGHKGRGTRLERQVKALAQELPAKPRRFKPIEQPLAAAELLELIDDAERVELVFLDEDGRELRTVAPRTIEGGASAWSIGRLGLCLAVPSLLVAGRGPGEAAIALRGFALLLDGDLAALAWRHEQLTIGAGSTWELKDEVFFG